MLLFCQIEFGIFSMGLVYATHNASEQELTLFTALLSIYRDGSGAERESDGSTRANWRQIERCVADLVGAQTSEDIAYGYSVKSKQLSTREFSRLVNGGRVYMEISNSPAKFWAEIESSYGLNEDSFRNQQEPEKIGNKVI